MSIDRRGWLAILLALLAFGLGVVGEWTVIREQSIPFGGLFVLASGGLFLLAGILGTFAVLRHRNYLGRRERADKFRLILEAGGIGSWNIDAETGRVDVDARCAAMFELAPVEAGEYGPFLERIHPDDRTPVLRSIQAAIRGRSSYDASFRLELPDGSTRHVVGHGAFMNEPGQRPRLVGVNLDVTAQRRVEADLRATRLQMDRVVEEAPLPIMLHAEDGEILVVNRAWLRGSGYRREELATIHDWTERAYGDGAEEVRDVIRALFEDSEPVDEGRFCIRTASGEERIWSMRSARLADLADGRRLVMTAACDVTQQDFARELERSNRELEQFAYVASHDLQEPLRMVASFVQLLERRYAGRLDEDADKYIHYAVDGVERMRALIEDLLSYSRAGRGKVPDTPIDGNALVQGVLNVFQLRLEEVGGSVVVGPLPRLRGNRSELGAVFQNLVENAIKYRGEEPVRIEIVAEQRDGAPVIRVSDNGIGFAPDQAERIFRPFQRLHDRSRYDGNGIGLAIVQRIVHQYGGEIWAESNGRGASFFVRLPGAGDASDKPEDDEAETGPER